jgi:hypothetical protein
MARGCHWAEAVNCFALLAAFAASTAASAADWKLDSFSFVHFPGASATTQLPSGISIPLEISEKRSGVWNLRVRTSALPAQGYVTPGGTAIGLALEGDAGGECTLRDGGFACRLMAIVVVVERDVGIPRRYPISFTTGLAGTSKALLEVAREGAALDPASGALQLVGLSEIPLKSGPEGGDPFYVVLSGRIEGLPTLMVSESSSAIVGGGL